MNIDLENNKSKKRKRNIIDELGGTIEKPKLKLSHIDFIPCEICKLPVYNYRCCNQNHVITCSYECFSVYQLSQKNTYLDEHENIKKSFDDIDNSTKQYKSDDMEIEYESDHSWTSY